MAEDKVKLNEKEVTKEQLEEKRKEAENSPGMKLVEVKPGEYRTKLED